MKGLWLVSQLKQLHMFGIRNIYHCGSMEFPGISIDANSEATARMTWIMIDNTSKASCVLNRNPALFINKYPICRSMALVFRRRFESIPCIYLLWIICLIMFWLITVFMSTDHILNSHLVVFECYIPYLYFRNYLRTSLVSNSRPRICCQLTPTLYHCATED